MQNTNALSKLNDNPQLIPATVITTNTTVVGAVHDLSDCADAVVSFVLTTSAFTGAGSVKLLLAYTNDGVTFTTIANDDLYLKNPATGAEIDSTDKAAYAALSGVGVSKLGLIRNQFKYVRASIVSTGITGSVTASVVIQYEKRNQR